MYKRALPAPDFLQLGIVEKWKSGTDKWKCVVGHNRYATIANSIEDKNAHPFKMGKLIGVHNGSLPWKYRNNEFDIDSEGLYNEIEQHHNNEKELLNYLTTVQGSYALVWYNQTQKCLYITRNQERPMFFAWAHKGDSMIFASEMWMLSGLAARNNLKLDYDTEKKTSLYQVVPGQLLKIYDDKPPRKCKFLKFEPYEEPKSVYHTSGGGYSSYAENPKNHTPTSSLTSPSSNSYSNPVRVNNLLLPYQVEYGQLVRFELEKAVAYGTSVYYRIEGVLLSPGPTIHKAKVISTGVAKHILDQGDFFEGRITEARLCVHAGYDIEIEVRSVQLAKKPSEEDALGRADVPGFRWRGPGGAVISGKRARRLWRIAGTRCGYCQRDVALEELKLVDGKARWTADKDELLCGACVQELLSNGLDRLVDNAVTPSNNVVYLPAK